MMNCYLIHYTKLHDRLPKALATWQRVGIRPKLILNHDGDNFKHVNPCNSSLELWHERLAYIRDILLANTGCPDSETIDLPIWMRPRPLSIGEQSVLLKHFTALLLVANSSDKYAIISEDDVLSHQNSQLMLNECFDTVLSNQIDYLDLAGGCNLAAPPDNIQKSILNIDILKDGRTRTSACYMISKLFAVNIVDQFLPAAFPIDWHLQYLLRRNAHLMCAWTKEYPMIHGSEAGIFKSWRD